MIYLQNCNKRALAKLKRTEAIFRHHERRRLEDLDSNMKGNKSEASSNYFTTSITP